MADQGLMMTLHKGDYQGLIRVMGVLKQLRDRQRETDVSLCSLHCGHINWVSPVKFRPRYG